MQVNGPVGIIGLGLMGTALSERLIGAMVPVVGFDITQAGLLRAAIALKGPNGDSAAVIEPIRRRPTSSEIFQ
jgi:3-hydroxyisobutyrate dehydrogenase-like beta-hydroxyacid dehydrogenase